MAVACVATLCAMRPGTAFLVLALFAAILVGASPAIAQQAPEGPPLPTWGPNGFVRALARAGTTLLVGGEFDYVGPPTGALASVAVADAADVIGAPTVLGPVYARVAADGAGGWFAVSEAAGATPPQLVHLAADGSRDPSWHVPVLTPYAPGGFMRIVSVVADGGRVFIGGQFGTVNGSTRTNLAALDASTGALLPWNATFTGNLLVPFVIGAVSQGRLFVTGSFDTVNGALRTNVVAIDTVSGTVLPFSPPPYHVTVVTGATPAAVYAWCTPTRLCAFDATGAPLAGWNPPALDNPAPVAVTSAAVYTVLAGTDGLRVIALDPATGARRSWNEPRVNRPVADISVAGGRVYLAGEFTRVDDASRGGVAAIDETTGVLLPWAPRAGGFVGSAVPQGSRVAIAGAFNSVGGIARRNLVAIDLTTGRPVAAPETDFPVWALHAIADIVVAAGGTGPSGRAIAFSASSGTAFPWGLSTDGVIYSLASTSRHLFLGGGFFAVDGQPRNGFAAVDLTTAALAPLTQGSVWNLLAMSVSNGVVYASGFVPVPGVNQRIVVALDANTLQRLPFTPTPAPGETAAFGFAPGRVLLAGTMSSGPRQAAWFDATSGQWLPRASAQEFAGGRVGQVGGTLIVSGNVHPGLRVAVELIDAATGASRPWDPGLVDGQFANINAIHAADDYVILGGTFDRAGGLPAANVAVFRAPRAGAPRQITASLDFPVLTLGWQAGESPAPMAFVVEAGTAAGHSNIGRFTVGLATRVSGHLPPGRTFIRVRGLGAAGEGPPSSEVIVDVPAPSAPPSSPGTLSASVAGNVVAFAWQAAPGNATTYVLEAGSAPGLANLVTFATGNLDTWFATPAPPGRYYVRLRAANAFGAGPATNEVVVEVP